jgi:hypothetical protein
MYSAIFAVTRNLSRLLPLRNHVLLVTPVSAESTTELASHGRRPNGMVGNHARSPRYRIIFDDASESHNFLLCGAFYLERLVRIVPSGWLCMITVGRFTSSGRPPPVCGTKCPRIMHRILTSMRKEHHLDPGRFSLLPAPPGNQHRPKRSRRPITITWNHTRSPAFAPNDIS